MSKGVRRIVTGHDADGNACLVSDGAPGRAVQIGGPGGPTFFELWSTHQTPALIARRPAEPAEDGLVLGPPQGGTRLRVIEFPPEGDAIRQLDAAGARESFGAMGGAGASQFKVGAPHPLMHRTPTVDYGIVLEGEITLIMDQDETTLRAGDVVVQCGTNHAWANRSDGNCRMAFVLIDGQFTDGL